MQAVILKNIANVYRVNCTNCDVNVLVYYVQVLRIVTISKAQIYGKNNILSNLKYRQFYSNASELFEK